MNRQTIKTLRTGGYSEALFEILLEEGQEKDIDTNAVDMFDHILCHCGDEYEVMMDLIYAMRGYIGRLLG